MKKWTKISTKMPNPITAVLLLHKSGDWEIGQRNDTGSAVFILFSKSGSGDRSRRGFTHYCQIQWPGEKP